VAKVISLAPVIMDTGIIYALADRHDAWHHRAIVWLASFKGRLVVPVTVVPEACYLLNKHLFPDAEAAFVRSLANGELKLERVDEADMSRALDILATYADANIGLVDATVVAVAERLKASTILTTDRRHFSMIRPKHRERFVLEPEG
jgi:predicted nucleic acid-binding protein